MQNAQAQSKAVILTTHNMDEADRCATRVAVIDRGKVLVVDRPSRLKEQIGEGSIIEVELGEEAPSEARGRELLGRLEGLKARFKILDNRLVAEAERVGELVAPLLTRLEEAGVAVGSVVVRQPTLEDVFLKLTGRRLRE